MTTDVMINNIINDLCQRFNVASSELIPRLQAYGMAMNKFGAIVAGVFCIALIIITVVISKTDWDFESKAFGVAVSFIAEIIFTTVLIYNIYMYIGWKYAPEIKSIEYVMQLFKK